MKPSDQFYKLRRASMLLSLLLVVALVIGVHMDPHAKVFGFMLNSAPTGAIPFFLEVLSWYFFLYFLFVYLTEAPSFLLTRDGPISVADKLEEVGAMKDDLVGQGKQIVFSVQELGASVQGLEDVMSRPIEAAAPIQSHRSSGMQPLEADAFNAISSAIRRAAQMTTEGRSIGEPRLRENIRWDLLAKEIVRNLSDRAETGVLEAAVSGRLRELKKQYEITVDIQSKFNDLDSKVREVALGQERANKKLGLIQFFLGSWKGLWFVRSQVFDAALPIVLFACSQAVFWGGDGVAAWLRHAIEVT